MKKIFAVILSLVLILSSAAFAESANLFAETGNKMYEFASGAGAWSTELFINEDGSFEGYYHDSEMGETGDGYPDGTVYSCQFHGKFTDPVKVDDYTWTAKVTVELDAGQALSEITDDGIRFVLAEPYGLAKAKEVTFFLPGKPVDQLPEAFISWSHLQEIDPDAKELPFPALWSEADDAGFVFMEPEEDPAELAGAAVGGWAAAEDPTVTDEVKALLAKGLEKLVGVTYEPVTYLGSQVVAGTNHAILCKATAVSPSAVPAWKIVYLYQDLQGNVTLMNIADFDAGSLCTYGAQ